MDRNLIDLYAKFVVERGANVQPGQTLQINCPVEAADFARLCARHGYAAGAREVVVQYGDEQISRMTMENCAVEVLEDVKPWLLASRMEYYKGPGSVARIAVYAEDPEVFKGLDTAKIDRAMQARSKLLKPWSDLSMANKMQWCVASVPIASWARKVFPGESDEAAMEKLWQAILKVCRVDGGDPAGAWQTAIDESARRVNHLNSLELSALHLVGENGTDLMVGLAEDCVFEGLSDESSDDAVPSFLANIPSEEIFTAPHKDRVDGIVKSSLPYVYNGNLIEGITARFEKGKAVEVTAEKGNDLMQEMMSADEGARRLGEIALVPASSPIRQSGVLFYNTLFDENAACHMAFGAGYPTCIKGGGELDRDALAAKGLNDSLIHEDVMIGTEKMNITGIQKDGGKVAVFTDGEWAF